MSELTSESTNSEVSAALENNALYDFHKSLSECALYCQALRIRINRLSEEIQQGNNKLREDHTRFRDMLAKAERWYSVNDTSGAARSRTRCIGVQGYL